jgi:hypothetical protein
MDNLSNVLWDAQLYALSRSVDSDNLKVGKQASTLIASAPGNCSYQRSQIIYFIAHRKGLSS